MNLPDAAHPFNQRASEYDSWFDESPLFSLELAALQATGILFPKPALEIGVGTGRFAQALGVDFGLDPAISPLHLAQRRSIIPINGTGEQLPFRSGSLGTLYMLFTLCFLADPEEVCREAYRALAQGGYLVLGIIPAHSSWGKHLAAKGKAGSPFYRHARFRPAAATRSMLEGLGFAPVEAWSTLLQPPGHEPGPEQPRPGMNEEAGFCVMITRKKELSHDSC